MKQYNLPSIAITSKDCNGLSDKSALYIRAVEKAGGKASFVCCGMDTVYLTGHYDGFIIPGGRDLPPSLYNEEQRFSFKLENNKRIDFEFSLLHEIMKSGKPVLGICYGMQLINVFLKGSLYQDIESQHMNSLNHKRGNHIIKIDDNPYLEAGEFEVNSSHHQAIKVTGINVRDIAHSSDGLTEAFCIENYGFLIGVQWHPERMNNNISNEVFDSFIEACRVAK